MTLLIVSGLWGGYTAPNVLKWHWHRFNGYGYFWGMMGGMAAAMALPLVAPQMHPLQGFPIILLISVAGCVAGSLLSEPEPDEVLVRFYKQVRPWGFWGPVLAKVRAADPTFAPNRDMPRDMLNVAVGIVWQLALVLVPLYMVLGYMRALWLSLLVLVLTSLFLKKNWMDKLEA